MLHVTNGDSAAGTMRTVLSGEVLPWRDVLHDGPVREGLTTAELARERAAFLGGEGWGASAEIEASIAERDARLARAMSNEDEIVLWFEHDLYDQLQLIQVLDRLSGATNVSIVLTDDYLGAQPPGRFPDMFARRTRVTDAQVRVARDAWSAFRAPHPSRLAALANSAGDALPYLGAAIQRLLEQYPDSRTGLSRTERQALEVLATGPRRIGELFVEATQRMETAIFLGDASFVDYLSELAAPPMPLLRRTDGRAIGALARESDVRAIMNAEVEITDIGGEVLSGRQDRVAVCGLDRWIGGVHLAAGSNVWRWDAASQSLVRSA